MKQPTKKDKRSLKAKSFDYENSYSNHDDESESVSILFVKGEEGEDDDIMAIEEVMNTSLVEVALENYFFKEQPFFGQLPASSVSSEKDEDEQEEKSYSHMFLSVTEIEYNEEDDEEGEGIEVTEEEYPVSDASSAQPSPPPSSPSKTTDTVAFVVNSSSKANATTSTIATTVSNTNDEMDTAAAALERIRKEVREIHQCIQELDKFIQNRNRSLIQNVQLLHQLQQQQQQGNTNNPCYYKPHKIVIDMNRILRFQAQKQCLLQDEHSLYAWQQRIIMLCQQQQAPSQAFEKWLDPIMVRSFQNRTNFSFPCHHSCDEYHQQALHRVVVTVQQQNQHQHQQRSYRNSPFSK